MSTKSLGALDRYEVEFSSNSASQPPGMIGHLDLVCGFNPATGSGLRRQSFRAPLHISKPYQDAGVLVVNLVNPTAGLFEGDRLACRVSVEPQGAMLLTAPSATRVHTMGEGYAEVSQQIRVANGGWFESWPDLLIPQRRARYRQITALILEKGGELLVMEFIAPGRVASGETFEFTELSWQTDLFYDGKHLARERCRLTPESEAAHGLRAQFSTPYYASCFVVSHRIALHHPCWERIHALQAADVWVGCGAVGTAAWVVKLVADGSVALRRATAAVRKHIYAAANRPEPGFRRAG